MKKSREKSLGACPLLPWPGRQDAMPRKPTENGVDDVSMWRLEIRSLLRVQYSCSLAQVL